MDKLKFFETLHSGYAQVFEAERVLFHEKTKFQELVIFENKIFGNVMMLDGVVQTTSKDEMFYHEMIVHVPMFTHPFAKNVLVVGGGDGGTIREVLKHSVEKVVLVEIDESVISLSKKYFPKHSNGAFDDPRLQLFIADGCIFVKECTQKFDVIIIDSTDPIGVGEVLFSREFYADCQHILSESGIIITQSGVPFFQHSMKKSKQNLSPIFRNVDFFLTALPTYIGGFMTLGFSSNFQYQKEPIRKVDIPDLSYYNADIHRASFVLPEFIRKDAKD